MRLDMIRKTSLLRKINPIARRSSFARKIIYNSNILRCASAEMTWRLRLRARELLRRSQTRINLLFTMSEIPHARLRRQRVRSDVSRTTIGSKCLGNQTIWWSQTGSNRRPHACKARALPAELWPRTRRRMLNVGYETPLFREETHPIKVVGLGRLELPTSRLSSARSNQLSYKPLTRGTR
jgi:hypothetical protein